MIVAVVVSLGLIALSGAAITIFFARRRERQRSFDERRYALLESIPDGLFIVDEDWRFTHVNESAERLLGRGAPDLVGKTLDRILDPLASDLLPEMIRARESGMPVEFVQSFESTDRAVEVRVQPSSGETLVYLRDVTERRRAEKRLGESERRLRMLLQQVPAVLWTADLDMCMTSASGATLADYALRPEEIVGRPVEKAFAGGAGSPDMRAILQRVFRGESLRCETSRNDRWLQHEIEPLRASDGAIVGAIGAALDITEMKLTSQELARQARIDALTKLPNRLALEERLEAALIDAGRENRTLALMFMDLDRFKVINDSLGHRAGDEVLRCVSRRLEALLAGRASVFRPGGDEFVVITEGNVESAEVAEMAAQILDSFAEPIAFEGRPLPVTASIGASLYPQNATDSGELIKQADSAMYRAKDAGRQNAMFYSSAMHNHILERMSLELDLRQALARDELYLVYQPIVELATEKLVGAEALVRWRHPVFGDVEPNRFVGIAEEIGSILDMTDWVLRGACAHAASMRKLGVPAFRVAINISMRDLCDPTIHERIASALRDNGLGPDALSLEVTEGITLNDSARRELALIHTTGVQIVIDDFGIGYSSLDYIKRLPVSAIKIDRSFVAELAHSHHDQAIVKAITTLAESLGINVVAEGVETTAQRDFLLTVHAPLAQGFYFSRPVTEAQFEQMVRALPELTRRGAPQGRVVSLFRSG